MEHLSRLRFMNTANTRRPVRRRIRSRGVPNALADHLVAASNDPRQAEGFISDLLGRARIRLEDPRRLGFEATLHAIQTLDITMAHLDLRIPASVEVNPSADAYSVHMTTSGEAAVSIDGLRQPMSAFFALVVSPGQHYELHLQLDSPQLIVRIEREAMERQLSRMLGRSLPHPIVFDSIGDLTVDHAVRWHGALQILSSEVLSHDSLLRQGTGADALGELVVSTLLYIQPHNYSDQLMHRNVRSGRPAVRRSIDYIEEHLAEPIALADLAAATGMSTRSIQAGFREDLDTTPVAFIRDQRLQRVRNALVEAIPGEGRTVTDIAERWGFTHLGNFAVHYRRRFGESPSTTLRR